MNEKLYEAIFRRKSCRKYDLTPLSEQLLQDIKHFADNLKPLFPAISVAFEITDKVKNLMPIKAPYYFVISSENKEGYLTNVGFMFQQMDLYLSSMGLGSCWLGMAKPAGKIDGNMEFVIVLAFGSPAGSPYRERSGFKRKPLTDISAGQDERIECAQLAPSASNTQNWFFVCKDNSIHLYQKKPGLLMRLYERMNKVDMGIALCHLYLATLHKDRTFAFTKEKNMENLKGYSYVGTVL